MAQLHNHLAKWLLQYAWEMDQTQMANKLQNEDMGLFQVV